MSDGKFVNRTSMMCRLHNIDWEVSGHPIGQTLECPLCLQEERNELREKLSVASDQRDALVKAMKPEREAADALKDKLVSKYELSVFRGQPEVEILALIKSYETARGKV